MQVPDPMAVLTAAHLEELEAQVLFDDERNPEEVMATLPGPTLEQVTESARRIRYHEAEKAKVKATAAELAAPLLAQLDQIRAWEKEQTEDRDRRIGFHQFRLIAFAHLTNPAAKHVDIPGARIQAKQPAPKWDYGDEKALLNTLGDNGFGKFIRYKPELDKNLLKDDVRVESGHVYLVNGDGEKVELPVTVTTPPVEYTVKLTEPKGA